MPKPELRVTVFSDYICPFCYVGERRLARLREHFELKVRWCSVEIHPDTPASGMPLSALGYAPQVWSALMANLERLAREEGLVLANRTFTTNSHRALLLAEAAKEAGREVFYALHERLFHAYFCQSRNIGDEAVLRELARESGVSEEVPERAWREARYEERLRENLHAARRLGVTGTPTFVIGKRLLHGVVPLSDLQQAAEEALG